VFVKTAHNWTQETLLFPRDTEHTHCRTLVATHATYGGLEHSAVAARPTETYQSLTRYHTYYPAAAIEIVSIQFFALFNASSRMLRAKAFRSVVPSTGLPSDDDF
jgi:hypothetical protein